MRSQAGKSIKVKIRGIDWSEKGARDKLEKVKKLVSKKPIVFHMNSPVDPKLAKIMNQAIKPTTQAERRKLYAEQRRKVNVVQKKLDDAAYGKPITSQERDNIIDDFHQQVQGLVKLVHVLEERIKLMEGWALKAESRIDALQSRADSISIRNNQITTRNSVDRAEISKRIYEVATTLEHLRDQLRDVRDLNNKS